MTPERIHALVFPLLEPERRRDTARVLARELGADELFLFVRDREVGALLPAPGFPRTFPSGRPWRAFLDETIRDGRHVGRLPLTDRTTTCSAEGLALADGSALVLLGGDAADRNLDPFAWPLAYVTSSLGLEADCEVARAHLVTARQAEVEARALALALDRSRQDLRQALEQAREARDRLARELATRDEFLAAVAHDLKNPLTAIKGIAQILRRRVASRNISDVNWLGEGLATLDATATRMTGQLDQLLDLTRLRLGGPLELDRRPLDLAELVRRVADVFQKTTERHDLRVETPAELVGEWDPVRLERVVTNLISNAVKYSPDGGVIRVALRCEEADGRPWAVLSIEDQGMGISAADLPAIFERFHRGANTVGRVAGSGIGLASARHMVERHGGSIGVASELGRGSTFTVRLPLTPIEPGPEV